MVYGSFFKNWVGGSRIQRQACGNCMEGKSAPPVMIPMSRSSRDYRASKNPKVSSEDTSSASAASKKSQIRPSGSPTRSTPATKKAKTGGSTLVEQNRSAHAIETSSSRSDCANQPLRPASSRSKARPIGDVTLDALRPSKKSKISCSTKTCEASAEDNDSLIFKNLKNEGVRKKQASGTATPSKTPESTPCDNAVYALKLPKSGAGSAGGSSYVTETNAVGGSASQISEGAVIGLGSSEPPELTEQRSLRPRPKPPVSKKVVKRTRFHDVSLVDSDGPRIVGRRIKVFWPLDKKWYYGSVKAYNGAKKQHKIIYDDHDEEWLKLQKESFRLEVRSGDSFGFAAPSSDLADLADLVATAECDESSKHRGDAVDGSTSASDVKPSAERTSVRGSKAGRDYERKRKGEGTSEEKNNLDGTSEHRKKAGRGTEKKKLEGDSEPKKKTGGGGDRGKKTDATKAVGRMRGDDKQKATKGQKLGHGKRAVLEVYERRKKRAQGVGTSGPTDRKGKGIASDGLSQRRKRTAKEYSRKGSTSQGRTRHSASEATEGKKTSRRGIRDNDRLFASIKSPSAVLRRKVSESKRSKDSNPVERTPAQVPSSREEAPEDEEKVFSHPQGADAGPVHLLSVHEESRGKVAGATITIGPVPLERTTLLRECDIERLMADVTDEGDAACEEADSPTPVHDTASDDKVTGDGCRDELPSSAEFVPLLLNLFRDDATGAVHGEQVVERQKDTDSSDRVRLAGEFLGLAECVHQSKEGVQQIGNETGGPTLQAVESRFEFLPSILEESSNQEVLRSAFLPVTIPTSEMKHPPDKVYVRVRNKIHKVYRRETPQSSQVQKKGVHDEGPRACAPVVEPVVQQLSASSCVISALHVILDGPLYFGVGLEGPRYLSSLRISGLGRWSRLRDDTLQLGTYLGVPGVLSLLRVSRKLLRLFLTTITQSKNVVGFSLGAVLSPKTRHAGPPRRRRRIIISFHPYSNDPLRDYERLSFHRQFVMEPSGIDRSFQRLFVQGSPIPHLKIEHAMAQVVTPRPTCVQELPVFFGWEGGHLPYRREISSGDGTSRSSGAEVVPLLQRWISFHSPFKQIWSASSFFNMRRGSVPNALLDAAVEAALRERWMVKFPVASVPGESAWHNPRAWGCREVGTYYGRRSLLSLLRVSVNDLCIGCSFPSSRDDGWQLAVVLMVVRDVYRFCKDSGLGVSYISGRDCKDLVRVLIRKLLADRAIAFHLARVWGFKVVTDLREIADYYDGFPRRREVREIAYELTQLCDSRSFHRMAEKWGNGSGSGVAAVLVNYVGEMCNGLWGHGDYRETLEYNPAMGPRYRPKIVIEESDPGIISDEEVAPTSGSHDMHPLDASWSCGWIPRSVLSPEEMCASTLSRAVRRPRLPLASPSNCRAYFRKRSAFEGTALSVGRGSTIERMPSVFVVLDKVSHAAAGPILLFTSGTRNLPEVCPRTSVLRCTDVGTYIGGPSIESFLRISKDFWRRIFQRPREWEGVSNVCSFSPVPLVDEEPIPCLFSQWPELSSVDTVDTEDLSDLEDRLQVTSAERSKVGESFEGKESKENSTGEDSDSLKTSSESLGQPVRGCRTGKGLKRGFASLSADGGDTNGAETECASGGNRVSDRPYSKRTRADIESSGAAVITENGVETSSPSSDVDGNGCTVPPLAAELKTDESALPRVNVLKLRRCPTNKGLWRVAGNTCAPPQDRSMSGRALEQRDSGEGAELVTPVFEMSRKRGPNHCSESSLLGRNDQSGTSVLTSTFSSNLTDCSPSSFDQDILGATANKAFPLDSKPKEVWYDCGMTYINDVSEGLEPRKRRKKGPSPPTHSDDVETVSENALRRSTDSGWVPCMANVLITRSDMCLRETGAVVELQSGHGNTWMLSVTLNGESKFAYKADQPVATGTSNKFTHAMMWRGGKDWSLEFVDRKQWQLFKDLHEDCFQRTVRAATVRHIPIPGVKQIPDTPRTGMRFVRPFAKYIHQTDGEVEAALSRVIYDMDSEDEDWLNQVNSEKVTSRGTRSRPRIDEDTLEIVIDKLEKISFVRSQQEPLLTCEVAAEVCQTLASQEAIRAIHGYWYDKRSRKGMALVRHFQPAPWEQYQKLLEDWQSKVSQLQQQSPTANKQQLQSICKRPPLFAFCLRPRGLENRNKMQKQRSQRKQGLGGSSSRQWTLAGPASDFFLDSPSKRPAHLESSSGSFYGSRKYARQRMAEESLSYAEPIPVDLTDSFNALVSGEGFTSSGGAGQVIPSGAGATFSQVDSSPLARKERAPTTRPHNKKKAGRKARKMRLIASAEESRRKRHLRAQQGHVKERFLDIVRSPHSLSQFGQPPIDTPSTSALSFPQTDSEDVDLEAIAIAKAAAAKLARETATAKRARAQALYAVADAAMHKAVAAVIAADAIHASERAMEKAAAMLGQEVESPEQTGEVPVKDEGSRTRLRTPVTEGGTSFGSWRRALNSASRNANHLLSKGTSSKQGLMPDTDDPLLPVASWSQELGAGLGTRLLQTGEVSPQRQRYSPVLDGLSKSPTRGVVHLGRTRGESMMAMLTR